MYRTAWANIAQAEKQMTSPVLITLYSSLFYIKQKITSHWKGFNNELLVIYMQNQYSWSGILFRKTAAISGKEKYHSETKIDSLPICFTLQKHTSDKPK